ncbi:hypothetical protein I5588_16315 [Burkholderia multivorans]|uniref:hypothetical protein n=1 Tax=Burkholderia multivorans TaxID=87883 RepID=UPI0019068600|nr:hypothetical protein [Burkholderia multivorans]MBJ9656117.1 hypothetical protein [Burkholderia multivorans]
MSDNERRLESLMRVHSTWSKVSALTAEDSDVEVPEPDPVLLRRAFDAFVAQIGVDAWLVRRDAIAAEFQRKSAELIGYVDAPRLEFGDTIAWYLYLCELAIARPYEIPTYYSSRALPFIGVIGTKLKYAKSVKNLDAKVRGTMTDRKREPDGFIFEILVALSYAELGWTVEFLPESSDPTPDMRVERLGVKLLVECKRMSSRSQYAIEEEALWRRHWEEAVPFLRGQCQSVWLDVVAHVRLETLPNDWLSKRIAALLPLTGSEATSSDEDATVRVRLIDREALESDLKWSSLKLSGSKLRHLLGGDWVPENAITSLSVDGERKDSGVTPGYFSTFLDTVDWASGATFSCDADDAIERKARDVKATIARAVRQLPDDQVAVLHVAFETLEGLGVEAQRMKKVISSIQGMESMKAVIAIVLHALGPVDSKDQVMVIDETSSDFWRGPPMRNFIPRMVVLPAGYGEQSRKGAHWL